MSLGGEHGVIVFHAAMNPWAGAGRRRWGRRGAGLGGAFAAVPAGRGLLHAIRDW